MKLKVWVPAEISVASDEMCDVSIESSCQWHDDYHCHLFRNEYGDPRMLKVSGFGETFRVLRCNECKKATGTK